MHYYQDVHILIRPMNTTDPAYFANEECAQGWDSTPAKLERRIQHEQEGLCDTFVAEYDGSGVWYKDRVCDPYAPCVNDDDLVLYMIKDLNKE